MHSRADFMRGLIVGTVAGLGFAVLLRTETAQATLRSLQKPPQHRPHEWDSEYPRRAKTPPLLRERPERGGNPANLSPEKSSYSSTPFERLSGAPGSPAGAEQTAVPGRPGETADLSDASRAVRPSSRTIPVREPSGA